jgi:hypothetical protein
MRLKTESAHTAVEDEALSPRRHRNVMRRRVARGQSRCIAPHGSSSAEPGNGPGTILTSAGYLWQP